jgi:hypothetical protein
MVPPRPRISNRPSIIIHYAMRTHDPPTRANNAEITRTTKPRDSNTGVAPDFAPVDEVEVEDDEDPVPEFTATPVLVATVLAPVPSEGVISI